MTESSLRDRVRKRALRVAIQASFATLGRLTAYSPLAWPSLHGVRRFRDVPYFATGRRDHLLDVYVPKKNAGLRPVVLYLHGGGLMSLSKETHLPLALAFARRGFVVFNANYRLAPSNRYPAAHEDAARAYVWMVENAARYGGDVRRLVLAGESAGANLAASLAIAACYERPEPFAKKVFATGVVPRVVLPACGILQITDPLRIARRRPVPAWLQDRISEVGELYLPAGHDTPPAEVPPADPLLIFERGEKTARPLPTFFSIVGTRDILLDDTRRLKAALDRMRVPAEARYYERGMHAFHAFFLDKTARQSWADTFAFLDRNLS